MLISVEIIDVNQNVSRKYALNSSVKFRIFAYNHNQDLTPYLHLIFASPPAAEYGGTFTSWIAALSAAPTSRLFSLSAVWQPIAACR